MNLAAQSDGFKGRGFSQAAFNQQLKLDNKRASIKSSSAMGIYNKDNNINKNPQNSL
jgi:hypothetical protein